MALSFWPHFEGVIERLIKDDILHPLDFSNSYFCIDCNKGKYVSKLRKVKPSEMRGF
jgi:hypothetical protein